MVGRPTILAVRGDQHCFFVCLDFSVGCRSWRDRDDRLSSSAGALMLPRIAPDDGDTLAARLARQLSWSQMIAALPLS
jgi:hypothetical protein